ncbi:outer membrane protein assembly factor BamB family protein [Halocatena halophila]|uniref:outer membrane protein assembly factor BamB family protein n=1 Tax=Halocatena halophila TaxID=2814576 RepID=UPI002ECFCD20
MGGFHERDSVCVVDGTVYATGDALAAYDTADGSKQWEFVAENPDSVRDAAVSDAKSPTVMDGTVFVPVRMSIFDDDNPLHAALIAVDADSGEKEWRIDAPVGAGFSDVAAVDGSIYTTGPDLDGDTGRFVYALDPADGSVRWRRESTQPNNGDGQPGHTPVVTDELVIIEEKSGVRARDTTSGDVVWEALSNVDASIAMVSDGTLFLETGGPSIVALNVATGEQQWKRSYEYSRMSLETIDAERLYIQTGAETDDVVALDRTSGEERWRTPLPQPSEDNRSGKYVLKSGMARVGELLYVGSVGLDPTDGSIVWSKKIRPGRAAGTVLRAVAGGRMYFRDVGMDQRLIVMKGSETQTGSTSTLQPGTPDQHDTGTTEPSQPDGTDDLTVETDTPTESAPPRSSATKDAPDTEGTTTSTNGPGFGLFSALAGVGVGAWRCLNRP